MDSTNVVLVTGGNTGMGKATALALASRGARVVILCRNAEKGRAAVAAIRADTGNAGVELLVADLGSFASIREAAADFHRRFDRLDVLVNNAGLITTRRQETVDGHELQFGVNHLGHFLLTQLLMDRLQATPGARIVVLSSGAHKIGRLDLGDLGMERRYGAFKAYARSKLANLLFVREFARRHGAGGVTINAVHPGAVGTDMGVDRQTGFGGGLMKLLGHFFLTPEQGAETAVFLAGDPSVAGQTGGYWYRKKPASIARRAGDQQLARELWEASLKLTGLA